MATRKQVTELAEAMGVDLEITHDSLRHVRDADAWTTPGQVFLGNFCHCFVVRVDLDECTLSQFYDAVLGELKEGTGECDIENCDYCHPEGEE